MTDTIERFILLVDGMEKGVIDHWLSDDEYVMPRELMLALRDELKEQGESALHDKTERTV